MPSSNEQLYNNEAPKEKHPVVSISISEMLSTEPVGLRLRRARYAKTSLAEYLYSISEPDVAKKFVDLHQANPYYNQVCAGAKHHHYWVGGMKDHVTEMIGVCLDLYDLYKGDLQNYITRDDIIIACYLHDFAKVWTYELLTDEIRDKYPDKYKEPQVFKSVSGAFNVVDEESKTLLYISRFGIHPTEMQWSAVLFAEGGYSDANFTINGLSRTADTVMSHNPLAVLVHMADMYSSQILGGSIA